MRAWLSRWSLLLAPTLAAAGGGLLAWLGISVLLLLHARADVMPMLYPLQVAASGLGIALLVMALAARASWRPAVPPVSTRWDRFAARACMAAVATATALLVVLLAVPEGPDRAVVLGTASLVLAASALAAVACAAMARSAGGNAAQPLAVTTWLLLSLGIGLGLLFCLMARLLPAAGDPGMLLTLSVLALLVLACQLLRWRGAAPAHTDRRPRLLQAALLATPMACWGMTSWMPAAAWVMPATLALAAAAVMERDHNSQPAVAPEYASG